MKKMFFLLLLFVAVLFVPTLAISGPFLTCDPPPEGQSVDEYIVQIDDDVPFTVPIDQERGTLWFDMINVQDGTHTVTVKARNLWAESVPSDPLSFTRSPPPIVLQVVIVSE
jgi:hypothetical protein